MLLCASNCAYTCQFIHTHYLSLSPPLLSPSLSLCLSLVVSLPALSPANVSIQSRLPIQCRSCQLGAHIRLHVVWRICKCTSGTQVQCRAMKPHKSTGNIMCMYSMKINLEFILGQSLCLTAKHFCNVFVFLAGAQSEELDNATRI